MGKQGMNPRPRRGNRPCRARTGLIDPRLKPVAMPHTGNPEADANATRADQSTRTETVPPARWPDACAQSSRAHHGRLVRVQALAQHNDGAVIRLRIDDRDGVSGRMRFGSLLPPRTLDGLTAGETCERPEPEIAKPQPKQHKSQRRPTMTQKHQLPELPYAEDALQPHISAETLALHHGKHHATYVDKLNGLIEGTRFADARLSEVVAEADGGTFNNAAQAWNHAFYWHCLSPQGGGDPEGELATRIGRDFGSTEALREQFSEALTRLFGSGWVWLALNPAGNLVIESRGNAGNPLRDGMTPILTCDMWEHAYYVDYRNRKKEYVDAFWKLVNWDFAAQNLSRGQPFEV